MNTKTFDNQKYKSFISFFLGMERPKQRVNKQVYKLIMNENGNISADYSDPVVVQNIKTQMKEFENIPLSEDIRVHVKAGATKK